MINITDCWKEPDVGERERLYLLIEELNEVCLEAIHSSTKILRSGYDTMLNRLPVLPNVVYSNRERLEQEIGDVLAVLDLMQAENDLRSDEIEKHKNDKARKLPRFTRFQK